MTEREWIDGFAAALGADPPGDEDVARILELAAVAAHASARTAAPVACWMAAGTGLTPVQAVEAARGVASEG